VTVPRYRRVILKISGESFCKPGQSGIDPDELSHMAGQIQEATEDGAQIGVVVGGGNFVRGAALAQSGQIHQSTADYMGMLATVMNGLALREVLSNLGCDCRLMSAIEIPALGERFVRSRAMRHLEQGRILILAAGTGNPFFTTDTCAALRGAELNADVLLKATKVDGVYSADPAVDPDAIRYDRLTFTEAIEKQLGIMDLTAQTMCMENDLPVIVFDFKTPGNIRQVIAGAEIGTLISRSANVADPV
jgi:uridylate kinase